MSKTKKLKLPLRCKLSDEERLQIGQSMTDVLGAISNLENDAKSMASDFKARIAAKEATLACDRNKLASGYELRDVDCEVEFDTPKPGYKRIVRQDTFEQVESTRMTDEEKQLALELDEKAGK